MKIPRLLGGNHKTTHTCVCTREGSILFTKAHSSEKSQNYSFAGCILARNFNKQIDRSNADPKFHSTVRLQTSSDCPLYVYTDLRHPNSLQFIFLTPELV